MAHGANAPAGVVLETKYAWEDRYLPVMHKVSYFNETPLNPIPVRAFRFEEESTGVVTMKIKADPCDRDWLGDNNYPNGNGYVVLRRLPTIPPAEIAGDLNRGFSAYTQGSSSVRSVQHPCRTAFDSHCRELD